MYNTFHNTPSVCPQAPTPHIYNTKSMRMSSCVSCLCYTGCDMRCKPITHTFFKQQTMIDNVTSCTEVQQKSSQSFYHQFLSANHHLCKCCACWMSFPRSLLNICQFVYCKIALYLGKKKIIKVGNMLIGRLFEPVKWALLFLGSGITFTSLQAWGNTLSSRFKLKI
jgi:hypothetical protein